MSDVQTVLSRIEVEDIARVAAREAAQEVLLGLGIDSARPLDTQRDFAHLRWWRELAESVTKTAIISFFLAAGATLGGLIWLGVKISVHTAVP
jgi:hypothetical protein